MAAWGNLENAYKAKAPLAKGQIVHFCFFEARQVATFREREVRMAVAKAGGGAQCLWAGLYLGRWKVLEKVGGGRTMRMHLLALSCALRHREAAGVCVCLCVYPNEDRLMGPKGGAGGRGDETLCERS